jgi:hypothetical protein
MPHTIFTAIDNEHARRLAELDTTHRLHDGTIWSPEDYDRRVAREMFRYEQARTAVRKYYQTVEQWEHEQTGFWAWELRR